MLGVLFLVASSLARTTALQFTDCATDKSNTALTVHFLDIYPDVIVYPGQFEISTNITIPQQITHLFVDTVLEKQTLGTWTKISCSSMLNNFGSCFLDLCTRLDQWNGCSVPSNDFGQQLTAILRKVLGHKGQCPICPKNIKISHETITVQGLPGALQLILQGKYRMTVSVKEDPTNPGNRGCIQFQFEVARKIDPNAVG